MMKRKPQHLNDAATRHFFQVFMAPKVRDRSSPIASQKRMLAQRLRLNFALPQRGVSVPRPR